MSSEPETQTAGPSGSETPAAPKTGKKPADSLEERLLAMDAHASKKALHDSRTLKRAGIVFYVLGGLHLLFMEPFLFALPHLPGVPKSMHDTYILLGCLLLPLVVVLPSFGFALRHSRSTAAQWLFRIVFILMLVGSILQMIDSVQQSNWGVFIGFLVAVLTTLRLCIISFNNNLFGSNPPSHNQLGYIRSKWKAGEKPDHIPEHIHKPPKFAKAYFCVAFLMIPYSIYFLGDGISDQMAYSNAYERFQEGVTEFEKGNYGQALLCFRWAEKDPKNEEVHIYLGIIAARGLGGCKQDEREAFYHLTRFPVTTNFYPDAQYELARLYLYGLGTDQDIHQAALLLKSAAEKGQRAAKALLGYDMSDMDENGMATGREVDTTEPDYGGLTVEEYLKDKIEKEAVENAGKTDTDAEPPTGVTPS